MVFQFVHNLIQKIVDVCNRPYEEAVKESERARKERHEKWRKQTEEMQSTGKCIHYCERCHAYAPILPFNYMGTHEGCGGDIFPFSDVTKESFNAMTDEEKARVKDRIEQYIAERDAANEAARLQWLAANTPKCPMCHSTNFTKISTLSRSASVAAFGLASSSIGKQYKCNKCGHKW